MLEGASYLDLVVGDDEESSREARRSAAALSLRIPALVDEAEAVSGLEAEEALAEADFTFVSSSVSDSSSELDSSSEEDSSFLAFAALGCVEDWRNLL